MPRALILTKDNGFKAAIEDLPAERFPTGGVRVKVLHSTLNYKDALAITGQPGLVSRWPLVAGVDLSGTVISSSSPDWKPGDTVLANGCGLGESEWGGLAELADVSPEILVRNPAGYTTEDAMTVGTAGFTAALCILALRKHGLKPEDGDILVTGAVGGVGSIATLMLSKLGYSVVCATGRLQEEPYLRSLGAKRVIHRDELAPSDRPLRAQRWAGVVDSVGSHMLASACAETNINGAVTACGLAQGKDFPATVMPFILRGITLYGINCNYISRARREEAWQLIASCLSPEELRPMRSVIKLSEALDVAPRFLKGEIRGRVVVDCMK